MFTLSGKECGMFEMHLMLVLDNCTLIVFFSYYFSVELKLDASSQTSQWGFKRWRGGVVLEPFSSAGLTLK